MKLIYFNGCIYKIYIIYYSFIFYCYRLIKIIGFNLIMVLDLKYLIIIKIIFKILFVLVVELLLSLRWVVLKIIVF